MGISGPKRRLGIVALAAIIGTTARGERRAVTAADLASPLSASVQLGRRIADLGAGLVAAASHAASFGILDATVMSRIEPGMRRSLAAAVDGWRGAGAPETPRCVPVVSRCASPGAATKVRRCSRA